MNSHGQEPRHALVTGAARGIGKAIAQRLAKDGIALILADRDAAELDRTVCELVDAGAVARGLPFDVSDEASVAGAFSEIGRQPGRLDIVVNSAGIMPRLDGRNPRVEETPLAFWQSTLAVNLIGVFLVCRSAIPLLRNSPAGRIVNISSRAGRMSTSGNSHYSASKAGVFGLSRVLAKELGQDGITVNCIAPSAVDTSLHEGLASARDHIARLAEEAPLGRIATTEDVANGVAFLISLEASFITGTILDINGGTYMP
jgi:3-oxoacyl-[acyl-carrier protein] reductase